MGYVKRKCSNAGKISLVTFEEIRDEFLADINAEAVMNEIPNELIFRQTFTLYQLESGQCIMPRKR